MEPTAGRPPAAWLPVRAERSDGNKTLLERLPEAFEGKKEAGEEVGISRASEANGIPRSGN